MFCWTLSTILSECKYQFVKSLFTFFFHVDVHLPITTEYFRDLGLDVIYICAKLAHWLDHLPICWVLYNCKLTLIGTPYLPYNSPTTLLHTSFIKSNEIWVAQLLAKMDLAVCNDHLYSSDKHVYVCICIYMCIYIYVCICIYICVYIYICMCICIYMYMYVYVYICICICMYIYVYVCIYI